MRVDTAIMIGAVGALMMCSMAVFATSALLAGQNPDPYEHDCGYQVSGSDGSVSYSGTASCSTVHENGSFHNYQFHVSATGSDSSTVNRSLMLIFDSDGLPYGFTFAGNTEISGQTVTEYSGTVSGAACSIYVGQYCSIIRISIDDGGLVLTGDLIQ